MNEHNQLGTKILVVFSSYFSEKNYCQIWFFNIGVVQIVCSSKFRSLVLKRERKRPEPIYQYIPGAQLALNTNLFVLEREKGCFQKRFYHLTFFALRYISRKSYWRSLHFPSLRREKARSPERFRDSGVPELESSSLLSNPREIRYLLQTLRSKCSRYHRIQVECGCRLGVPPFVSSSSFID